MEKDKIELEADWWNVFNRKELEAITTGLSELEKINLTNSMMNSGTVLKWNLNGPIVDKHSTGGVGDTVSLILAPLLASLGCFVPMISGKGLGHTGGTLDKLSSIPGYEVEQSEASFQKIVSEIGCAIVGQTSDLVPADKILYSTRDVTSTVDSVDLITASIISKKLASGIKNLILDVKVGRGALMTNIRQAKKLAKSLVSVSKASNCKTKALITSMDDPLSSSVGNSIEVETVVEVLLGKNKNLMDKTIYQFKVKDIDGKDFDFESLRGKKIMIVNTASKCGLTPQYKELQKLYDRYKSSGFVIVGFPANNFLWQEPGSNKQIADFCEKNYGVTFPMMAKISVKGSDMHAIYKFLTQASKNGYKSSNVSWNFQKYLIGRDGRLEKIIAPRTSPMSQEVLSWVTEEIMAVN